MALEPDRQFSTRDIFQKNMKIYMNHTNTVYQFVPPGIEFPTKSLSFRRALGALHGSHSVFFLPLSLSLYWTSGRVAGRACCTASDSSSLFVFLNLDTLSGLCSSATCNPVTVLQPVPSVQTWVNNKIHRCQGSYVFLAFVCFFSSAFCGRGS